MINFLGLDFKVSYKDKEIFIRNKLVNFQITNFPILGERTVYVILDNTSINCITSKSQKRFIKNEKFALATLKDNSEFIVKTILDKKGNLRVINLKTNEIKKEIKKLQTKSELLSERKRLTDNIAYWQYNIVKFQKELAYIDEQMKKDSSEKIEKLKKSKAFKDRDKLKGNYKELYAIVEKYNIWI
jgi:hypothetical protein